MSHVPEVRSMEYPSMAYAVDPKANGASYLLTPTKVQADSFISSSQMKVAGGGILGALAALPTKWLPGKLAASSALPYLRSGLALGAGYLIFKAWRHMKDLSRNMQDMVQDQILRRTFFGPYMDPYRPRQGSHDGDPHGGGHDAYAHLDPGRPPKGVPGLPEVPHISNH